MPSESNNQIQTFAGARWLCHAFDLELVNPLPVVSRIGSRRRQVTLEQQTYQDYPEAMQPVASVRGHLTFHLKHEPIHLEMLSRLFDAMDALDLVEWATDEPSSQYAKRAGFLYEWMTGRSLPIGEMAGNNIDALDSSAVVTATEGKINRRWKVRDNMPGTPAFCPIVRRTESSNRAMSFDCGAALENIDLEFGHDLLVRSAVWLTLRESKSSFQIEGELDKTNRIQRFADVIQKLTGRGEIPLSQQTLSTLQKAILGEKASIGQHGIRKSPVFVGESVRYQEIIHYVAPPAQEVEPMLEGLQQFLRNTQTQSPVMRSAVGAFGFVYIHPLADGNGRVHRFLINDILRRDKAIPEELIIPVSSFLTSSPAQRRDYDEVLDVFSKPMMENYSSSCSFSTKATVYEDGIASNFNFEAALDARHAWRFIDLTPHVEYMGFVLEKTIAKEIRYEARHLRSHYAARDAIKEILEMPDHLADRVIRSVEQNNGALSGALQEEIPALNPKENWPQIVAAVRMVFSPDVGSDLANQHQRHGRPTEGP